MKQFPGQWCSLQSGVDQEGQEENQRELFHWLRRSMHCTATIYQKPLALLLCWEGAALIMPSTSGIIKAESGPMFFGLYNADFKCAFYIYGLKDSMSFWDSPIMQLLRSQNLTCTWPMCCAIPEQSACVRDGCGLLAHSCAPKSCLWQHGTCLHLTQCLWQCPWTIPAPNHTQGSSSHANLPAPQCHTSSSTLGMPKLLDGSISHESGGCQK